MRKDVISIRGTQKALNLRYEDYAQGSKNAALPLIGATLVFETRQVLENFPEISDVRSIAGLLDSAGVRHEIAGGRFVKHEGGVAAASFGREFFDTRGGFYVVAGLIYRLGTVRIDDYLVGGCQIGERGFRFVFEAFQAFGIDVDVGEKTLRFTAGAQAPQRRVVLNDLGIVVSGIALILAAQQSEPVELVGIGRASEINDVIMFLEKNGVEFRRHGERDLLVIPAKDRAVREVTHSVQDDRIVIATYIAYSLASGGEFVIDRARLAYLRTYIELLVRIGYLVEETGETSRIRRPESGLLVGQDVIVDDYPAISTDIQPLLAPLLCRSEGVSTVTDRIFPERNFHVAQLRKLNQHIAVEGGRIVIHGARPFVANDLASNDMRCSATLLVAAAMAEGVSTVANWTNVERGYQHLLTIISSHAEMKGA